jgi:hypothetical protein
MVESASRRRLIVEGKLVAPWAAEFMSACEKAKADLHGREFVVDLRSVTAINPEGEQVLLQLITAGVKFQCGVFMKEVLRQLARKRQRGQDAPAETSGDGNSV